MEFYEVAAGDLALRISSVIGDMTYPALQGTLLRIFLSVVERCLREHSSACPVTARRGAVAFIHRFGSSLNEHVEIHCCVIDGIFEPAVARMMRRALAFMSPLTQFKEPGIVRSWYARRTKVALQMVVFDTLRPNGEDGFA